MKRSYGPAFDGTRTRWRSVVIAASVCVGVTIAHGQVAGGATETPATPSPAGVGAPEAPQKSDEPPPAVPPSPTPAAYDEQGATHPAPASPSEPSPPAISTPRESVENPPAAAIPAQDTVPTEAMPLDTAPSASAPAAADAPVSPPEESPSVPGVPAPVPAADLPPAGLPGSDRPATTQVTGGQPADGRGPSDAVAVVSDVAPPTRANLRSSFGIGTDIGISGVLPDAGLSGYWRPRIWLQVQLGVGFNGFSPALRGGLSLVSPKGPPVSVTVEGGRFFAGDANPMLNRLSGRNEDIASLRSVGYEYVNALAGLTTRGARISFFFRAGFTWMRATVNDFGQTLREAGVTGVEVSDPKVTYHGPTARLGLIVFL